MVVVVVVSGDWFPESTLRDSLEEDLAAPREDCAIAPATVITVVDDDLAAFSMAVGELDREEMEALAVDSGEGLLLICVDCADTGSRRIATGEATSLLAALLAR